MSEPFDMLARRVPGAPERGTGRPGGHVHSPGPHIVPVNYAVVDDALVLRTSPYSVLGGHARGSILAI